MANKLTLKQKLDYIQQSYANPQLKSKAKRVYKIWLKFRSKFAEKELMLLYYNSKRISNQIIERLTEGANPLRYKPVNIRWSPETPFLSLVHLRVEEDIEQEFKELSGDYAF